MLRSIDDVATAQHSTSMIAGSVDGALTRMPVSGWVRSKVGRRVKKAWEQS